MIRPLLDLVAVVSVGALATGSNVLVVASSGTPYSTIPAAIQAAVDGDVILVRVGPAPQIAFEVVGKSLTVCADGSPIISVSGTTTVSGISAGQPVTLIGFEFVAPSVPESRRACATYSRSSERRRVR